MASLHIVHKKNAWCWGIQAVEKHCSRTSSQGRYLVYSSQLYKTVTTVYWKTTCSFSFYFESESWSPNCLVNMTAKFDPVHTSEKVFFPFTNRSTITYFYSQSWLRLLRSDQYSTQSGGHCLQVWKAQQWQPQQQQRGTCTADASHLSVRWIDKTRLNWTQKIFFQEECSDLQLHRFTLFMTNSEAAFLSAWGIQITVQSAMILHSRCRTARCQTNRIISCTLYSRYTAILHSHFCQWCVMNVVGVWTGSSWLRIGTGGGHL